MVQPNFHITDPLNKGPLLRTYSKSPFKLASYKFLFRIHFLYNGLFWRSLKSVLWKFECTCLVQMESQVRYYYELHAQCKWNRRSGTITNCKNWVSRIESENTLLYVSAGCDIYFFNLSENCLASTRLFAGKWSSFLENHTGN